MFEPLKNYEGLYWINKKGQILTKNWKNTGREAILKPAKDKKGYLRFGLQKNGKLYTEKAHRLVAIQYLDNPLHKTQVNHINGIKDDNRLENLEWVTCHENVIHGIKIGKINIFNNKNSSSSLLKEEDIINIRTLKEKGMDNSQIAKQYNVSTTKIRDINRKRSWKHL